MPTHRTLAALLLLPLLARAEAPAPVPARAAESKELIRTLHEGANFKPYTDKAAWQKRAAYLREQVLISAGLWPMPEKCPLNAVIHGRIERDDYTIEKVYFQSYPGFYVTGNLYRPKGKAGPFPAILSPHGHWNNGRLYEAPEKEVKKQIDAGLEKDPDAARYPLQSRCANLAKLGCIVFFYDMVGYADADPERFPHRGIYRDLDSDLHGLSVFGLQTWDSIRSLDFLESLADVDTKRIAITGASGGASQSIMMMVIDDRLAAAAPVCMISAGEHQGGCVCENNSLLRIGTDNVELAATFAPRPFIHPTATGDWTKDFLEHGFPEIQATYKLFGAEANVESMRQTAPHNYNMHAREAVYNFFNKHLKLGHEGVITEAKFTPVKPKELSVWDEGHPRPTDSVDPAGLKKWWVEMTARQMEAMKPKEAAGMERVNRVLRPVLAHVLGARRQDGDAKVVILQDSTIGETVVFRYRLSAEGGSPGVTLLGFRQRQGPEGNVPVLLTLPRGSAEALKPDGTPIDLIAALVKSGRSVLVPELMAAYDLPPAVGSKPSVEFFAGYNYSIPARRVQELLVLLDLKGPHQSDLIAVGDTAQVGLLTRAIAPDRIRRTIVDGSALSAAPPALETDVSFLPHLLRYGGLWPMASLGGSTDLTIYGAQDNVAPTWLKATYDAAGAQDKLHIEKDARPEDIVRWLNR